MGQDDWDSAASERVYKYIFTSVCESMGRVFVENMAGIREDEFRKEAARDSVIGLVGKLHNWLGQQVVEGILLNIQSEFRDPPTLKVLSELKQQVG